MHYNKDYYLITYICIYIQEYPPTLISPTLVSGSTWSSTTIATWSTTLSGQPYGNGVYRVTSAGGAAWAEPQWLVFGTDANQYGAHWGADNNYNILDGTWARGATSLFTLDNTYYGDWVHIQLPEPIVLSSCTFIARAILPNRAPSKFRIYGSNTGSSWTVLHDQTSPLVYFDNQGSVTVQTTASYTYIGLVVSALPPGGGEKVLNFMRWKIMGSVSIHVFQTCSICMCEPFACLS